MLEMCISYLFENAAGWSVNISITHYETWSMVEVLEWYTDSSGCLYKQEKSWSFPGKCHVEESLNKFTGQIHKRLVVGYTVKHKTVR